MQICTAYKVKSGSNVYLVRCARQSAISISCARRSLPSLKSWRCSRWVKACTAPAVVPSPSSSFVSSTNDGKLKQSAHFLFSSRSTLRLFAVQTEFAGLLAVLSSRRTRFTRSYPFKWRLVKSGPWTTCSQKWKYCFFTESYTVYPVSANWLRSFKSFSITANSQWITGIAWSMPSSPLIRFPYDEFFLSQLSVNQFILYLQEPFSFLVHPSTMHIMTAFHSMYVSLKAWWAYAIILA